MRNRWRRREQRLLAATLVCVAIGAWLIGPGVVKSAQAEGSRTISKQITYTCQVAGVPERATVGFLFTVQVPNQVSPGQQLSLTGDVVLRLPENVRAAAQAAEITAVEGYSDTVTFPVQVGDQTAVILANRVIAPRTQVNNPLTVSAHVSAPAITIPADATGSVTIWAPQNGTVSNPRSDADPSMVAFTAIATVYSPAGAAPIGMYCFYQGEIDREIATIPIIPADQAADGGQIEPTVAPNQEPAAPILDAQAFRVTHVEDDPQGSLWDRHGVVIVAAASVIIALVIHLVLAGSRSARARRSP